MVNPKPKVWIASVIIPACSGQVTTDGTTVVAGNATAVMLEDLSIDWGRSDVWSQPSPSVLTCTIWQSDRFQEANPTAATNYLYRAGNGTLVGDRLVAFFDTDSGVPSVRNANGFAVPWRFFEGRISNADFKRLRVRTTNGLEDGWAIRIQGSDQVSAVAQCTPPLDLPANQTMIQRADVLASRASGANIREIYFEAAYTAGRVKAVETKGRSLLDLVNDMYASFAHQYAYNPHRNVIIRIPAAYNHGSYSLRFGRRAPGDTVRLYAPRQVDNTGRQDPADSDPYPSAYVGACDVQGDVMLSVDASQRIRTILCKWFVAANNADHVTEVQAQTTTSPNTLQFESWYNDGVQVDPIMADVKRKILAEGSRPFHPRIVWDTARSGDVPDWETFMSLTLPMQSVRLLVLAGSPFAAALDVAPVWYPAGGTITLRRGKWLFSVDLAPAPMTLAGSPITFTGLSGNATGSTVTLGQLDTSISSHDLRYISDPNVTTWS